MEPTTIDATARQLKPTESPSPNTSESRINADLQSQVDGLETEQQAELERRIAEDSSEYFEAVERQVEAATGDIVEQYKTEGATLNPTTAADTLRKQGMDEASAAEAGEVIAHIAERAKSPEDFVEMLAKHYDPEQRLTLTRQHFRDRTPQSWYFGTEVGRARLANLLEDLG